MQLDFKLGNLKEIKTEAVIFFVFEREKITGRLAILDKMLGETISKIFKKGYFKGEAKEIYPIDTHGKINADKIILAGLGERKKFNNELQRRALASVLQFSRDHCIKDITLIINGLDEETLEDLGVIAFLSLYHFRHYKTEGRDKFKDIKKINFLIEDKKNFTKFNLVLHKAEIIGEAVNWTRDMINHPSNHITPKLLARYCKEVKGIKTRILGKKEIKKIGMGLLLGVSKGSDEEPQLIVMDYKPRKYKKTLVLVGKGITFDSGGISLKSSEKMEEMKMDMAGAGAVIGTMKVIAEFRPKMRIVGIIPATENLPSGKAIKPGDILISMSGKTVEVMNTDAEGRLILADALFFAQKYKPTAIIDLATLTGSCVGALGYEAAGLLGNDEKLIDKIKKSAEITGERVWQFPLWDDYREQIKGELADLNNVGGGRQAGTITAAAFLENFVGDFPWAHIDIAGTAIIPKPKHYNPKGATGYGVRLIVDLIEKWHP